MQHDDERSYHSASAYVHVGPWAVEVSAIWAGIDAAEGAGIRLDEIHRALAHNWTPTVVALARRNMATLRALVDEASP
jgi:hypothetical protein